MRLHEHEAADIFERYGIPVPMRGVAATPVEAVDIAVRLGCPVILKAQVLSGGRGLAGGIVTVDTPGDIRDIAARLLKSSIRGLPVRKILVSKKIAIARELYLGITVDGFEGKPLIIASAEGGMSIEETAKRHPGRIATCQAETGRNLMPYEARNLLAGIGLSGDELIGCADVLVRLFRVFRESDALIAEINPLAVIEGGGFMAVDAKMEIDDSAVSRQAGIATDSPERIDNPLERRGREIGVTYVDLDGDIGIIASGAGLGMATMDIVGEHLSPANFLETGGGITERLLYDTMDLMMMKKGLRAVFINIYGGINPIHEGAKGVVRYMAEHGVTIPVVAKALGNRQEETWDILRKGGVHVVTDVATEKAVERLVDILGTEGA